MIRPQRSRTSFCMALLVLAGCASTPDGAADAETARGCDEFGVDVPDVANLNRVSLRQDIENWRDVIARQAAEESRMERNTSKSALLAIEVRPDGSVAKACVARGSSRMSFDRSWLQAIRIARFRPDVIRQKGSWLAYEGR